MKAAEKAGKTRPIVCRTLTRQQQTIEILLDALRDCVDHADALRKQLRVARAEARRLRREAHADPGD